MPLIRLIALVGAALVMLAGCEGLFSLESPCDVPQDDFAFYEQWLGVKLPESTTNFTARCSRWMDHHEFWMQFDIAPDNLDALQSGMPDRMTWQADAPLTEAQMERMRRLINSRMVDGMSSYVLGVDQFNNYIALANTSDPAAYRVFLYVFISF
jgi:hypothetical protein